MQTTKRDLKSHRRAFTLIELLVVIAIIAILASILFPVFARARENARRASCQSNLKQIALGMFMYAQDYDEKFPGSFTGWSAYSTQGNPYSWADMLQPYLKSTQILQCPSEPNGPNTATTAFGQTPSAMGLGYSDYFMGEPSFGISDATYNAPSLTVLLGDAANGNSGNRSDGCSQYPDDQAYVRSGTACATAQSYTTGQTNLADTDAPAGRHLDGANYAFADGHVKWLKGSIISGAVINGSTAIGNSLYATTNGTATFDPK